MPELVHISELGRKEGAEVILRGWVAARRTGGKIVFLQVRDGTGICQCVVEASSPQAFQSASDVAHESSVEMTGSVRADDRAPGGFEISCSGMKIIHLAEEYPIGRKAHGIDFLLSNRHLWLRARRTSTILRIRHTIIRACRDFFDEQGFVLVDTPILCEGAGEDDQTLFPVQYFNRQAFLAQTGQLYLESACMALEKVYCFGPTFRAEKSKTRRHLTEFWMIEPEIAFADLDYLIDLAENMICRIISRGLDVHLADLEYLGRDIESLKKICGPFPRVSYSEAVEYLRSDETLTMLKEELENDRHELQENIKTMDDLENRLRNTGKEHRKEKLRNRIADFRELIRELEIRLKNGPDHMELARNFEWGQDLGGSNETILCKRFDRPVFVTHYPAEAKAFYMKQSEQDRRVVENMDLLAPEGYGEIIGGSQREEDLLKLTEKIREKGLNPADYGWYLDLRKYGSVPHGGFGLGLERTVAWICGLKHVREAIPFPRTMGRLEP